MMSKSTSFLKFKGDEEEQITTRIFKIYNKNIEKYLNSVYYTNGTKCVCVNKMTNINLIWNKFENNWFNLTVNCPKQRKKMT